MHREGVFDTNDSEKACHLSVMYVCQSPEEDDDSAEPPHFSSEENITLQSIDSIVQVYGKIRNRVTQSLVDCILTARRKTRPAANSCGGKSCPQSSSRHRPPAENSAGGKSDL